MDFELRILGSSSATPSANRHNTAQVLTIGNQIHLIDCGEGTQMQLMRYKIKHQRICNIYISHLHGDHYFGLAGLLSTMHLQGRQSPLNLFGPPGLSEILSLQFRYSGTNLNYKLIFNELDTTCYKKIFEDKQLTVHTIPMEHRVPTCGFIFREKPKPRPLIKEKLPPYLAPPQLVRLKWGEDINDEQGNLLLANKDVTMEPKHSRSYAYCSDSRYKPDLLPYLHHIDLLYHEATFLSDMEERANHTFHSTAKQAAQMAAAAEVRHLLLGHFSVRYKDLTPLLTEAREIFPNTDLAIEGSIFSVQEQHR
ncbi:ribonuclease Z [Pontibacter sp. BT310]|uniref:Ribonuclease Z n=1 Tax=Pontibacter populi TaxID=890055 RepID=A0ABS6XCT8_9BACT|nr:ribonuclease Z [Pontibacter populi]MBJ6118600.1 ribonuclease Z [Pontibacter sp. BT310]MBR0571029.1 ribonuclease Z [Microvirga sp. STS03]MBW3365454.1 ribonuclease Z [Pontibacter populi]